MGDALRAMAAGVKEAMAALREGYATIWGLVFENPVIGNDDMRNFAQRGAAELGEALKPFPNSIAAHEQGTVWGNGRGSEESFGRRADMPSPADLSRDYAGHYQADQELGHEQEHGYEQGL